MAGVSVSVFTEPWCPWSWAAEPARLRLETEFGAEVAITYVMAPPGDSSADAARLARAWLDAAAASGMPVDVRGLLEAPPATFAPAALAVVAAREQGPDRAGPYLRRLREAIALERRRPDRGDALLDVAREAGGLDLDRLGVAFGSNAIVEGLGADYEKARERDAPTPFLEVGDRRVGLREPYETWRAAVLEAGAAPSDGARPGVEELVRRRGPLATPEVAAACDLPLPRAAAELWRLALEWRITVRRVLGGELWSPP